MTPTPVLYIFDMGGVVAAETNVLPAIADYLNLTLDDVHVWTRECGRDLMEGTLTPQAFWRRFSERTGRAAPDDLFSRFFQPVRTPGMVPLIERLKQRHRVVCGTNTIAPHYEHHQQCGDYASFDAVYASHIMGIAKPRPEFYEYILAAEGMPASRAIFIDDRQENVDAARELGIHAIRFSVYEALVAALPEIGQ